MYEMHKTFSIKNIYFHALKLLELCWVIAVFFVLFFSAHMFYFGAHQRSNGS